MISKTLELKSEIASLLREAHENVFYRRASNDTSYPYIVFTIKDIYKAKELEINIWDYGEDTGPIEELVDKIEELVARTTITNEKHSITMYSNDDRIWVDDENKEILRVKETFEIRYYGEEQ